MYVLNLKKNYGVKEWESCAVNTIINIPSKNFETSQKAKYEASKATKDLKQKDSY